MFKCSDGRLEVVMLSYILKMYVQNAYPDLFSTYVSRICSLTGIFDKNIYDNNHAVHDNLRSRRNYLEQAPSC